LTSRVNYWVPVRVPFDTFSKLQYQHVESKSCTYNCSGLVGYWGLDSHVINISKTQVVPQTNLNKLV